MTDQVPKWKRLPASPLIYDFHVDRSTERDVGLLTIGRLRDKGVTEIIYQGRNRPLVKVDGGVLCWKCGKMRNTMNSAKKHFKRVHL